MSCFDQTPSSTVVIASAGIELEIAGVVATGVGILDRGRLGAAKSSGCSSR